MATVANTSHVQEGKQGDALTLDTRFAHADSNQRGGSSTNNQKGKNAMSVVDSGERLVHTCEPL